MRYAVVALMLIVVVALTGHFQRMAAGRQTEKSEAEQSEAGQSGKDAKPEKTDDEPLLLLDDDPPLLLDDDPPLAEITRTQVKSFLAAQRVSKKTVLNYHVGLSALYTWATAEQIV